MLYISKMNYGEPHCKWTLKVISFQNYNGYKILLVDEDDDTYYATNYLTAKTASDVELLVEKTLCHDLYIENIHEAYERLKNTFYGNLFYERKVFNPDLMDGIIIIASNGE